MELTRNITGKINYFLDMFIPPFMRDSKLCMYLPFKFLYGKKAGIFFDFKKRGAGMEPEEFSRMYAEIDAYLIKRGTDVNSGCMEEIPRSIIGESVLEIACGKGLLADKIQKSGYRVTGADICIDENLKKKYPDITFRKGNIEKIPFGDKSFDTVVSTHTLEHVQHLQKAISELRRVCKKRLIIVVPKQRAYQYTFDLHLHFFPYEFLFLQTMGNKARGKSRIIEGDIFYTEDMP